MFEKRLEKMTDNEITLNYWKYRKEMKRRKLDTIFLTDDNAESTLIRLFHEYNRYANLNLKTMTDKGLFLHHKMIHAVARRRGVNLVKKNRARRKSTGSMERLEKRFNVILDKLEKGIDENKKPLNPGEMPSSQSFDDLFAEINSMAADITAIKTVFASLKDRVKDCERALDLPARQLEAETMASDIKELFSRVVTLESETKPNELKAHIYLIQTAIQEKAAQCHDDFKELWETLQLALDVISYHLPALVKVKERADEKVSKL